MLDLSSLSLFFVFSFSVVPLRVPCRLSKDLYFFAVSFSKGGWLPLVFAYFTSFSKIVEAQLAVMLPVHIPVGAFKHGSDIFGFRIFLVAIEVSLRFSKEIVLNAQTPLSFDALKSHEAQLFLPLLRELNSVKSVQ